MVLIMLLLVISGWVLEMFFLSVPGGSGTQLVGGQKRPSSQLSSFPLRFDLSQKLTPRQLTQPTERRFGGFSLTGGERTSTAGQPTVEEVDPILHHELGTIYNFSSCFGWFLQMSNGHQQWCSKTCR